MSTFPEYTIDEIKQLQSSDNVLSVVLKFVEQGKPTTQVLAKQTKPVKKLLRKFDSLLIDIVLHRSPCLTSNNVSVIALMFVLFFGVLIDYVVFQEHSVLMFLVLLTVYTHHILCH
jgi:hypothetical protein